MTGRVPVLDRAADGAHLSSLRDRAGRALGLGAVAVLEVDGDREVGGVDECFDVLGDLVERDPSVQAPEREREAGARRRERLEPECREHARRAGVPWIRDHERLSGVELLEAYRPIRLGNHGLDSARHSCEGWRFGVSRLR